MQNKRSVLLAFDEPVSDPDGQGGRVNGWLERFQRRAAIRYLRGSETVIGSRLQGVQPVVIRVRRDTKTPSVTPKWRIRFPMRGDTDAQGKWQGDVINIKGIVPSDNYAYLEITATIGEPS